MQFAIHGGGLISGTPCEHHANSGIWLSVYTGFPWEEQTPWVYLVFIYYDLFLFLLLYFLIFTAQFRACYNSVVFMSAMSSINISLVLTNWLPLCQLKATEIETVTKLPSFYKRHSEIDFLACEILYFYSDFNEWPQLTKSQPAMIQDRQWAIFAIYWGYLFSPYIGVMKMDINLLLFILIINVGVLLC